MLGDSTTFRALPSVALTLPWSLFVSTPFFVFVRITQIDIFKSDVPVTIIIFVSGLLNSYRVLCS